MSRTTRRAILAGILAAVAAVSLAPAAEAEKAKADADAKVLWQIGQPDNSPAEFALAPKGYAEFVGDGLFVVGRSKPDEDWPYCHPGPADGWAGGEPHTFTILFALSARPAGACTLTVDLADTHALRPPVLKIDVNGRSFTHRCPPGGGDASITGNPKAGKEHRFSISLPPDALRAGLNVIEITNTALSWVLYDAVTFSGPAPLAAGEPKGTWLRAVRVKPWLSRKGGALGQAVEVDLWHVGDEARVTLAADGAAPQMVSVSGLHQTCELRLLPTTRPRQVRVELRAGEHVLGQMQVTQNPARERQPVDYVDCLIGTSTSRWMLYPGPSMPFGMVKLSPDNQEQKWKAGYEYTIGNIAGFSHLHSWTMGGLLVMPTVGQLKTQPGREQDPDSGYRSRFRHETEVAVPGYYAVTLDDYRIRSELTCTTRCGVQRHTFPKADQARILFDLQTPTEYGYELLDAKVRKVSPTEIEGYAKQRSGRYAKYNEFTVHFVAQISEPMRSMGGWVGDKVQPDAAEIAGAGDVGVFLNFRTDDGEKVLIRTGISLVSIEQARLNLTTETKPFGWDFDACRAAAGKTWNDLLSTIEVEGGTETDKVKLYTNLYRSYCARTIWSDVNGKYVDMYEKVQQLKDPDSPVYGCDAFWNTFWNLNQLWVLATPDIAAKWVRSLLEINDKGGWLPKGPTGIEYSSIMVASHEIALIVAAWQAGIRTFDADKAYAACRHIQTTPGQPHPGGGHVGNRQLATYLKHKYVPHGQGATSNTMEYAYDDWCVAQFAKALGKTDDYKTFLDRSGYWRNLFDARQGFVRPRKPDGSWLEPFDPYRTGGFVEGNAWQYTWFVPQDVAGLVAAMGRDRFVRRLDEGMAQSARTQFNAPGDRMASVPINHGNQPTMQVAYLFNYARAPWLTQQWSRAILDKYYGASPIDGWPGDEDQGQGGAWFAMSAMGLFQVDGGCRVKPIYEITSPLFDRVVLRLDGRYYKGKTFVVEARDNSKVNVYIQSATWNGQPLNRCWLYASEVTGGGMLVLHMGPQPNKAWAAGAEDGPPKAD